MTAKPQITWIGSPNFGYPPGAHGRQGHKVVAVVQHIMQGTLSGTDSWFKNAASGASAHFGVGKDGTIHQYVDINDAAWANGVMQKPDMAIPWLKECWDKSVNPNLLTVSIEYEGAHSTDAKGNITAPDWKPNEVQYQAGLALTKWLCETLGITPDPHTILGHFQIDAINRPYCPGPRFPFTRMLKDLTPPPAWTPQSEVDKALASGIISAPHDPDAPVTWWQLCAVANHVLDLVKKG